MHLVARTADAGCYSTVDQLCNRKGALHPEIWRVLWESAGPFGIVVSDLDRREGPTEVAVAIAIYIQDWALQSLRDASEPFALSHLMHDVRLNRNPFVRPFEVGFANAGNGSNLLMCYFGMSPTANYGPGLRAVLLNAFAERHGGNRLKWLVGETCGKELRTIGRRNGLAELNSYGHHICPECDEPCLMGVDQRQALETENHWLTRMFSYSPPRLFFTEPQRQILLLAREGYTDTEIALMIGANPDAVKKRWVAIYDRVENVFPHLLPNSPTTGRGSEKRRILLARLKDRSEELRAYDRKTGG